MSIKNKIINTYFVVGLLFALYGWLFGSTSYKSFAYNLGRGLVWPLMIFPELGKAIGGIIILVVIIAITLFVRNPNK